MKLVGIAMSLNHTNWLANTLALALVCIGFLLITGGASADAYNHKMTVSTCDPTCYGDPEETIQYIISVKNTGDMMTLMI